MARTADHISVDLRKPTRRGVPFMTEGAKVSLNTARIVEALVIAFITSLVVYVSSVPKLEARLDSVESGLKEFKQQVSTEVGGVKDEVKDLRKDLYVPAAARQNHSLPN